jgi:UDP-N-acetylglucosamine 2-epimerase (non-hydrolysing)
MKIAPFVDAVNEHNRLHPDQHIEHLLVHTGQHYDLRMSGSFFDDLRIPPPDINLEIGSGTHAEQVGHTMIAFEKVLLQERPDWVVVVGDVNATLACSVTAKKLQVKVCHIEAGLRSGDMSMPEEINRLVTDRLSDLLLTPDRISSENLLKEGVSPEKIRFVGNIMIDTLEANRETALALDPAAILSNNLLPDSRMPGVFPQQYALLTLHRPSNVDRAEVLADIIRFLTREVAPLMPALWPVHPRTQKMLHQFGLWNELVSCPGIVLMHPLRYQEMVRLNMTATIMLTDSGGLQEECCVLGTPCLTLRWNTERPITLRENGGAGELVGNNIEHIRDAFNRAISSGRVPQRPELWDGKTAVRCVEALFLTPQK